jgi:2-octaprenyl-6-methoxyphenol hydroxylase
MTFDLVIVGGGIVGTTLACALQNTPLTIALVEALPVEQALHKPQAYALSLLSSRILAGLGLWAQIAPQVGHFEQIRLSDADYPGVVPFSQQDLQTPHLGYVGEHRVILSALQEKLASQARLHWFRPAEVMAVDYTEAGAFVQIHHQGQTQTLSTQLVVGADGAKSRIRSLAGIKTRGWKYWQSCVAFTIQHQAPQNNIAYERFWYSGPMGVLPLPGNRCQIVWTLPHAQAQALMQTEEADFLRQLKTHLGEAFGESQLCGPRRLFPVQLMQSDRYIQPHLALIGDAAHCCHPVGGQGLNLGLRDAAALAEVLEQAHGQGQALGSLATLQTYENWRRPENFVILGFTDFLDRFFSHRIGPLVALRRLGLEVLRHVPPAKLLALRLMTGLLGRQPQIAQRG